MSALAIDLFCGLGGWTEGLLAEGWEVVGFDVERHRYPARAVPESTHFKAPDTKVVLGKNRIRGTSAGGSFNHETQRAWRESPPLDGWVEYPAQLVLQDVLTLHGSQFRSADLIVASPPCQAYSYRAMPWSRAKALPPPDNSLFDACFRIQREACEASGRYIPLIVENVRGAQKWVGRSRWNYGSFHLWGDVPALMPMTARIAKCPGQDWNRFKETGEVSPDWKFQGEEMKNPGFRFDGSGRSFQSESVDRHIKMPSDQGRRTDIGKGARFTSRDCGDEGRKAPAGTQWLNDGPRTPDSLASSGSKSSARKAASAMIAKIPLPLAQYIARTFKPEGVAA